MDSATNLLERHSSTGDLSSGPAEVEVTTRARATFGMDAAGNSTAEGVATTTATLRSAGSDEDIFEQVQMILRKRRGWGPEDSLNPNDLDLLEYDDELGEEDDAGCPLPSTPEDTQLIEAEVSWGYQPAVPLGGKVQVEINKACGELLSLTRRQVVIFCHLLVAIFRLRRQSFECRTLINTNVALAQ